MRDVLDIVLLAEHAVGWIEGNFGSGGSMDLG
jgi:hypothetical protein